RQQRQREQEAERPGAHSVKEILSRPADFTYQYRGTCRHRIIVTDEPPRLHRLAVWLEVICPAERDRLEPEFGLDLKRPLSIAERNGVTDLVSAAQEIAIVHGFALRGNLLIHFPLIEPFRKEPIVFDEAHGRQK